MCVPPYSVSLSFSLPFTFQSSDLWCAVCAEEWRENEDRVRETKATHKKYACCQLQATTQNTELSDGLLLTSRMLNVVTQPHLYSLCWGLNVLAAVCFNSCHLDIWHYLLPGFKWVHTDPESMTEGKQCKQMPHKCIGGPHLFYFLALFITGKAIIITVNVPVLAKRLICKCCPFARC